jgi:hypothetical protein
VGGPNAWDGKGYTNLHHQAGGSAAQICIRAICNAARLIIYFFISSLAMHHIFPQPQ